MMSHSPSLFTLIVASRSERLESTLHLKDVVVFLWLSAALLDRYEGTQLADVDKTNGVGVVGMIGIESMDKGWPGG
jgi:hypothetical protein